MSKKLALSSALSILMMAGFALFGPVGVSAGQTAPVAHSAAR
ncbi:MAG: hypothetical protein RLY97_1463 [Pseudomonadota bacterium]|jgi:hypothetical protein